jgi:formylglycine-generating enzyme required for sulfatase activity
MGSSPYGAQNMAGNVWEWVADWYGGEYYGTAAASQPNPTGPVEGTVRVQRGGARQGGSSDVTCFRRSWDWPANVRGDYGFRCAISSPRP